MTFNEFKAYMLDYVWRPDDEALSRDLPNLMRQANAELDRRLEVERRTATVSAVVTALDIPFPSDYYAIRDLSFVDTDVSGVGQLLYYPPSDLHTTRAVTAGTQSWHRVYSIEGRRILFAGDLANPQTYKLTYTTRIPDLEVENASWVVDEYYDIYVMAVSKQIALYMREDGRYQALTNELSAMIDEANGYSAMFQTRGVAGPMQMPTVPTGPRKLYS